MKTFKTVVRYDDHSKELEATIKKILLNKNYTYEENNPDLILVIGGDGTFLRAVSDHINLIDTTYFYGIHTGTLGFFTDYTSDELDDFIDDFINKEPKIKEYQLLEVKVDDKILYAVNEMRIENVARTQTLDIYINDKKFETYRGTGICISSQLGSSAYNRSLRGAIIQEGLPLIQMCEIAGIHHKKFKSLGVPLILDEKTKIRMTSDNFTSALLCTDSTTYNIDTCKEVRVGLCENKKIRLLSYRNISYFKKLQSLF